MSVTSVERKKIPVTIITGFLGAGKTTLLNRLLQQRTNERFAIIENEFGEVGVDNELLLQDENSVIEINNGCLCCTVRGDLVRMLSILIFSRLQNELDFDRVVIETTGLADPAPVAQTFFNDLDISFHYTLDGVITVVDAAHAVAQCREHPVVCEQIAFADRLLVTKTDRVTQDKLLALKQMLRQMNPRAPVYDVTNGDIDSHHLLDIHAFSLSCALNIAPDFLSTHHHHHHDDHISSVVFVTHRKLDPLKLDSVLADALAHHGDNMLRYKGILNLLGSTRKWALQGVKQHLDIDPIGNWQEDEKRESRIVIIGRSLPWSWFQQALKRCETDLATER